MQDRIKEHDRDIQLTRTETSAVSDHTHNTVHKPPWNEVNFIDRDPYCYTRRVKEAIHIRLHPSNINRDCGIVISEAWMPTTGEPCDSGPPNEQITEWTARIEMRRSELLKKQLITAEHHDLYSDSDNTMQVQGRQKNWQWPK